MAAGTTTIRVGAGGIMLPNHAPLVVAEQFGTLATLFPGRIDLGLGRAPGTDGLTARALRRGMDQADTFPADVQELIGYFRDVAPATGVKAIPGMGTHVPVWVLGSSLYGAQLAAHFGLPYAFASHFAPGELERAVEVYRGTFRPSEHLEAPRFMLAVNVFAGEDDAEGRVSEILDAAGLREPEDAGGPASCRARSRTSTRCWTRCCGGWWIRRWRFRPRGGRRRCGGNWAR